MRYYSAFVGGTIVILVIVVIIWKILGINLSEFATQLAGGLTLIIPVIGWWAYKKEQEQKLKRKESRNFGVAGLNE